jgi:hypothetical protein
MVSISMTNIYVIAYAGTYTTHKTFGLPPKKLKQLFPITGL